MSKPRDLEFAPGKNPTRSIVREFGVVDMETNRWKPDRSSHIEPFLITYYDRSHPHGVFFDEEEPWKNVEDFLSFYCSSPRKSSFRCFAHNGGKFDFLPIIEYLERYPGRASKVLKCDPIYKSLFDVATITLPPSGEIMNLQLHVMSEGEDEERRRKYMFTDSMGLFSESLERLTGEKGFDVEHKKWSKERIATLPDKYDDDPQAWREYCLNDCIGTYEVISKFKSEIEQLGGVMYTTIARTATLGVFQKKYLKKALPTYFPYNKRIHDYYKGGRTEVFTMYAPPFDGVYNYYDFNSLYPAMMHDYEYPTGYPYHVHAEVDDFKDKVGFAQAVVTVPDDTYVPLLPYTFKGKLFFPTGTFRSVFEGSLLYRAQQLGYDITIEKAYHFDDQCFLFRDYIHDIYTKRLQSKGSLNKTLKILMNSSYGKFAQTDEMEFLQGEPENPCNPQFSLYDKERCWWKRKEIVQSPFMLPALSARVTALGQLRMHEALNAIHLKGNLLFYCDTDSILTDAVLPTDTGLGKLKKELTFEAGIFLQPKTYSLYHIVENGNDKEEITKMKGFTLHEASKGVFGFRQLEQALITRDYSKLRYSIYKPRPFRTLVKMAEKKHFEFLTDKVEKSIQTEYSKRIVNYDTYETVPYRFAL